MVLVIIHHTAITYGGAGGWFYHEDIGENLLTSILLIESKGAGGFLKDRFIRLGSPLVFYVIFFSPYLSYQQLAREEGLRNSYMQFWLKSLAHPQYLGLGPLWFIEALLIFTLTYVVWTKTIARTPEPTDKSRTLTNKTVVAFAVILAITTGVVRIFFTIGDEVLSLQLAFFAQYIAFFILGVIAYRYNRLEGVPAKVIAFSKRVIIAGLLLWPVLLVAGGATSILEERQRGTLGRILTTPTTKTTYLSGKIGGLFATAIVQATILIAAGRFIFDVNWGREPLPIAVIMLAFIFAIAALGILIAAVARSTAQAQSTTPVLIISMAMIGGCYWPIEITPPLMQTSGKLLPTYWAMTGLVDLIVRGHSWDAVFMPLIVLLGFATGFLTFGVTLLKFE